MSPMMLLFFYIVGINSAVIVDQSDAAQKVLYDPESPKGWQVFKTYHPPGAQSVVKYETFSYPKYEFEYAVSDKTTGDHKHHFESRDGHRVRGEYGLVEADGSLRKVQYNADDYNGFNAVVSKTVNKHGDSAYSVFGHTRQFLPIGHGVKINHFFPSKDYHYQDSAKIGKEVIGTKPVQEAMVETSAAQPDEGKIESESNEKQSFPEFAQTLQGSNVEYQPIKQLESSIVKMDTVEGPSFNVLPVPVHTELENGPKLDSEVGPVVPSTEKSIAELNNDLHKKEEEIAHKEDSHADSEVASSYYHSKVYYVGF